MVRVGLRGCEGVGCVSAGGAVMASRVVAGADVNARAKMWAAGENDLPDLLQGMWPCRTAVGACPSTVLAKMCVAHDSE